MNKLPITVANFAANNEDRLEGYKKMTEYYQAFCAGKTPINGVSFSEANEKVHGWFMEEIKTLSGKDPANYSDLAMYANFTDVKEAAFAIVGMVTDLIIPDSLTKSMPIANIAYGAWGDSLKIDMQPRDLFIVSKGGRAKRSFDIKRQFKGTATIIPEPHVLTVGVSLYDILTGKYSLAEFIMKAVMSLEVNMKYDIYDAFTTALNALATSGTAKLKYAGYTQDDAIELAQKVTAWNGGKKAIFLGTNVALSKILPASTNYRFDLGSEYTKIGHVRDFFGFDCVELEQIADYKTEFSLKIANDEIYVISPMSDTIVKGFVEGSTLTNVNGNYANANLQVGADLYKSYNFGVHTSSIAGIIDLA
jgi:hypothetical protein